MASAAEFFDADEAVHIVWVTAEIPLPEKEPDEPEAPEVRLMG